MKAKISLFALLLGLVSGVYADNAKDTATPDESKKVEAPAPADEKKADEPKAEEKSAEKKEENKGILAKLFSKDDKKEEEKKAEEPKAEEPKAEEKKDEEKKTEEPAGITLPSESVASDNVAPIEAPKDAAAPKA